MLKAHALIVENTSQKHMTLAIGLVVYWCTEVLMPRHLALSWKLVFLHLGALVSLASKLLGTQVRTSMQLLNHADKPQVITWIVKTMAWVT